MNPVPHGCPCGHYTDPRRQCRCTPRQIATYRRRISGPLLDRIDIHVDVPPIEYRDLVSSRPAEASDSVRQRVESGRRGQFARLRDEGLFTNSRMQRKHVRTHCALRA